jgi:hypothetical protein
MVTPREWVLDDDAPFWNLNRRNCLQSTSIAEAEMHIRNIARAFMALALVSTWLHDASRGPRLR